MSTQPSERLSPGRGQARSADLAYAIHHGDAINTTLTRAAVAFLLVSLLFAYSVAVFVRRRTAPTFLQLVGACRLVVVVLTHIAEALHLSPVDRVGRAG